MLQDLSHPRISQLFEIYENDAWVMLVLEFPYGGTLYDQVSASVLFNEQQAALIIRRLMEILEFINSKNVIHRDIKLETIFLASSDSQDIKLGDLLIDSSAPSILMHFLIRVGDFELATTVPNAGKYKVSGTPGYMAPELFSSDFDASKKCDIFSCGIVLYTLYNVIFPLEYT